MGSARLGGRLAVRAGEGRRPRFNVSAQDDHPRADPWLRHHAGIRSGRMAGEGARRGPLAPGRAWASGLARGRRSVVLRRSRNPGDGERRSRWEVGLRLASGAHIVISIEVTVRTGSERGFTDLTDACRRFVAERGVGADGLLSVFVPHATAGVVILELGAGSDNDAMATLDRLLPRDDRWRHRHGSPGHGADHVVPLLASPSLTVPVVRGELALGTWQSIALLDPNADNAERSVVLSFLEG